MSTTKIMKKEEKQKLLLIDLCARLPYGVILDYSFIENKQRIHTKIPLTYRNIGTVALDEWHTNEEIFKPYLRPLSSMTDEELSSLSEYTHCTIAFNRGNTKNSLHLLDDATLVDNIKAIEWLNQHHFDYRTIKDENGIEKTMIELGLALEALEGMYEI